MKFESETQTITAGSSKAWQLAFLPLLGPSRGRLVISKILVRCDATVSTDGSSTVTAGGWAALIQRLKIKDAQGDVVDLTGPEIRAFHMLEHGRKATSDPAAIAVSQSGATRTVYWVLDFAPRDRALRRWDYALPTDHLHAGGQITINAAASGSGIGTGGGVTLTTLNFTLIVECREEFDLEVHSRRELRSVESSNLLDHYIPCNGGALRSAFLFKAADHATGGTDVSSTTTVSIDSLMQRTINVNELREMLLFEGDHDRASTADPFVQTTERVVPLVWPRARGKQTDMVIHPGQMHVRLAGNSVSNLSVVYELVTERTELSSAADLAIARAAGGSVDTKVKTHGKTRRAAAAWGVRGKMLPAKIVRAVK